MRVAPPIILTPEVRAQLESIKRSRTSEIRAQERASMILMAADGHKNDEIARTLGQDKGKVGRWRTRFAKEGIAGILKDKTRPGRIPPLSQEVSKLVVHLTVTQRPEGSTHWSRSTMAKVAGISEASVGRIWAAHGLKPHLTKGFKLSNDKNFAQKLEDIVGLYLSPPEHAIVLSCDEKSQIQALDRTQPGLPLKRGLPGSPWVSLQATGPGKRSRFPKWK
jgi:transposase